MCLEGGGVGESLLQRLIDTILERRTFAVVGASRNPAKFGNQVYHALKRAGYNVYAVNPNAESIDGDTVWPSLDSIPEQIECVVTVVPPQVTEEIARHTGELQTPYIWMQPGSESELAVTEARRQGVEIVYGGPCIMVEAARRAR